MPDGARGPARGLALPDRTAVEYLERARIHLDGARLVYTGGGDGPRRTGNVPHANIAVLMLGPGTALTSGAARCLAESGVHVVFTEDGAASVHVAGLSAGPPGPWARRVFRIVDTPAARLAATRVLVTARCRWVSDVGVSLGEDHLPVFARKPIDRAVRKLEKDIKGAGCTQDLMSREARFARDVERAFRDQAGALRDTARVDGLVALGDRMIQGLTGATLSAMEIPQAFHLRHDPACDGGLAGDLGCVFRDAIVLPAALGVGLSGRPDPERRFRDALTASLERHRVIEAASDLVARMTEAGEAASQPGSPA